MCSARRGFGFLYSWHIRNLKENQTTSPQDVFRSHGPSGFASLFADAAQQRSVHINAIHGRTASAFAAAIVQLPLLVLGLLRLREAIARKFVDFAIVELVQSLCAIRERSATLHAVRHQLVLEVIEAVGFEFGRTLHRSNELEGYLRE